MAGCSADFNSAPASNSGYPFPDIPTPDIVLRQPNWDVHPQPDLRRSADFFLGQDDRVSDPGAISDPGQSSPPSHYQFGKLKPVASSLCPGDQFISDGDRAAGQSSYWSCAGFNAPGMHPLLRQDNLAGPVEIETMLPFEPDQMWVDLNSPRIIMTAHKVEDDSWGHAIYDRTTGEARMFPWPSQLNQAKGVACVGDICLMAAGNVFFPLYAPSKLVQFSRSTGEIQQFHNSNGINATSLDAYNNQFWGINSGESTMWGVPGKATIFKTDSSNLEPAPFMSLPGGFGLMGEIPIYNNMAAIPSADNSARVCMVNLTDANMDPICASTAPPPITGSHFISTVAFIPTTEQVIACDFNDSSCHLGSVVDGELIFDNSIKLPGGMQPADALVNSSTVLLGGGHTILSIELELVR